MNFLYKSLGALALGTILMAAPLSAHASQFSLTLSDNSPGDYYVGSSLTGTIDFGNSIPLSGTGTAYDNAGIWTFTVTAATGNADITALIGAVFTDNYYIGDSYVNYTNGTLTTLDVTSFSMYYFVLPNNKGYIYNTSDSPNIDLYTPNQVLYADLANGQYAYPTVSAVAPVPEPASMALLAGGIAGLMSLRRRRRV